MSRPRTSSTTRGSGRWGGPAVGDPERRSKNPSWQDRERHETAECQEVEGPEQPRRGRSPEKRNHGAHARGPCRMRGIARKDRVHGGPHEQNDRRAPKDALPPEPARDNRSAEDRQGLSQCSETVESEGGALAVRGSPARDKPRTNCERRSGQAEEERRRQQTLVAGGQRDDPRGNRAESHEQCEHAAAAETIGQHAHGESRQRTEQDRNCDQKRRNCDQKRRLRRRQPVELGKDRRQPSYEAPGGERQRERDRRERQRLRSPTRFDPGSHGRPHLWRCRNRRFDPRP
jgi:hypothetical protein